MTIIELPFRTTTEQACDWLAQQTGTPWTLARLIENGLTPYVWLDYDAGYPDLFGDANGGYAAPIFFEGDTERLAAGSEDVLITITKDAYKIVTRLPPPGFRRALHELRFLKKELERLAGKLKHEAEPAPAKIAAAKESQDGINREQVLIGIWRPGENRPGTGPGRRRRHLRRRGGEGEGQRQKGEKQGALESGHAGAGTERCASGADVASETRVQCA